MEIWNRFGVQSWPTLVLLDTEGNPVGKVAGEGHYAVLDREIAKLVRRGIGAVLKRRGVADGHDLLRVTGRRGIGLRRGISCVHLLLRWRRARTAARRIE